jgi:cephalosporin-C deacetylase-like acetyl esterase
MRFVDSLRLRIIVTFIFLLASPAARAQQNIPETDRRLAEFRHLNLTYHFPVYRTKEEWLRRADHLRRQILVSAGLWPMPPRGAIEAHIFGKLDRGDYTVEKVYFESYPGFYVTGNLYRPKNSAGKVPAVLCTHGHWKYGRLENTPLNSGPARAANFARQGYVAFAYDMVGYNDSIAISHRYGGEREALWGISLLGLQLWNSLRAVDFLLSLPEVDPDRIGCTGESGGGTQTFLLAAVDDRIKVAAPVNMISAHMQGGDLCENAPNLRIDTYNVEFGAMMAPRPLLMVSATGDWTKNTLQVEYPDIRGIYRLLGAEEKVHAVQMDAPHNYNQASREAVYGWFKRWLLGEGDGSPVKEKEGGVDALPELLVFAGRQRPAGELDEKQLTAELIGMAERQLAEAQPRDAAGLERFRAQFGVAFKYSLMADYPLPQDIIASDPRREKSAGSIVEHLFLSRRGRGDRVPVAIWTPAKRVGTKAVLVATPHSDLPALNRTSPHTLKLIDDLVRAGHKVMAVALPPKTDAAKPPGDIKFFTTYNRTYEADRVQDILTALAYLCSRDETAHVSVVGLEQAGLWALLARGLAPQIDRMAVDVQGFDNGRDESFLAQLPIPGIRRAGDFSTAVTIAPLTPLLIHNTGGRFRADRIAEVYRSFGAGAKLRVQSLPVEDRELVEWLNGTPGD